MIRLFRSVTIVVILAAGAARSSAQPSVEAARLQAELDEAKRLNEQVEKFLEEGKYQEAFAPAQRALAIRERSLGPNHPDVAESLSNLALLHQEQGEVARAEPLYVRALAIREKALGLNHPVVASSLNDLAILYQDQGAYAKAESLHVRALAIRENALGPNHRNVAESLSNLAALYQQQNELAKAEPLAVRSLAIREKALGLNHPLVANSLNILAALYHDQGAYAKAEPLHVRALAINEKALGVNHPYVAYGLNNLAEVYRAQGAYAKAEPLHVRALAIREKVLGPNHPNVAQSLDNLAVLYGDQGAYAKAEPLLTRALAIRENALGSNHPYVANSLNNLGVFYQDQGAYAKAEPLLIRALAIRENALAPNHRDVAQSLTNLAAVYRCQGAYAKAEPLYVRSLRINERALGPNHPYVARNLTNLANLYDAQGAYTKAEPLLRGAVEIGERRLRDDLVRLPEQRKRAMMTLLGRDTNTVVSFHADATPGSAQALDLAITTVLRRQGRILDSLVDSDSRIRRNLTPRFRDLLDELSRARSDLATHLYATAYRRSGADRAVADSARVRIDELETKLSTASVEFRAEVESVTVAKVRAQLPKDVALVEFAKYRRLDPKVPWASQLQEERYVAYLLTSRGDPWWVALDEAAPIDAQVDSVLTAIRDHAPMDATRAALQRLDALVLAPVRAKLPGVSHLILAPDGQLNLVPFEALVDPQGHYAIEKHLISYVTTGRDLLRIAAPRAPRSPGVIVADPAYGPLPPPGPGTISFKALPDARGEATDLERYFPSPPLTGAEATKSKLAALTAPAILHIATHGFYARSVPSGRPAPGDFREVARGMYVEGDTSALATSSRSDDLADGLDRAGLALAGANQGAEGIVTAREIAGFDWWGTQLVVLSACDTGVGAASSGDGVYGLRRALVLAGAASQVVSLWAADDAATRALMREFYGNLARGVGRAEALRRAKLALLHQPQYEHPLFWAPFIAAGDWRPLPKGILAPPKSAP